MQRDVLLAVTGAPYENVLLASLDRPAGRIAVARRCLDLVELLACADAGLASVAVIDAQLRRLDREAVTRLQEAGVAVVGVIDSADSGAGAALEDWGVCWLVTPTMSGDELARVIELAAAGLVEVVGRPAASEPAALSSAGQLVAVWGPAGAPGRTTVAVSIADELSVAGHEVLLVDADTYGASVAQTLGLLDEGSGLAAAARVANSGALSVEGLAAHAREVRPGFRVVTGLSRPDRWPELPAATLGRVLACARSLADWTVVDCGFCLEHDEELSYDTAAPRRNAAATTTLGAADLVVMVVAADPVSVGRLIRALPEVRAFAPTADHRVVVSGVRPGAVGRRPEQQLAALLARHGAPADPVFVPYDRSAFDEALCNGQTLREVAPKSPARQALASLAALIAG